jgi:putative membrane protein
MDVNTTQIATNISMGKMGLYFGYFTISLGLLFSFVKTYLYITPYNEVELIKKGNIGLALILSGILLGYTISLAFSLFYSETIIGFIFYGLLSAIFQLSIQLVLQKNFELIQDEVRQNNNIAIGLLLGVLALCVGIITGISV